MWQLVLLSMWPELHRLVLPHMWSQVRLNTLQVHCKSLGPKSLLLEQCRWGHCKSQEPKQRWMKLEPPHRSRELELPCKCSWQLGLSSGKLLGQQHKSQARHMTLVPQKMSTWLWALRKSRALQWS